MCRRILSFLLLLSAAWLPAAEGGHPALIRIDRSNDGDRNQLIAAGVHLVAELSDHLLAVGEAGATQRAASALGRHMEVLETLTPDAHFALVGYGTAALPADLPSCGRVLWSSQGTALISITGAVPWECHSPMWFFRELSLGPLAPTHPEPSRLRKLTTKRAVTDPLVSEMVAGLTDDLAAAQWRAIVDVASTRFTASSGCFTATAAVSALFGEYALAPFFQYHTAGHAPSVIGTLTGATIPGEKIVIIGHIDDMPSSGPAPGANDNASGSAMVTALAEVMSCYEFARTVDFVVVTGEETGLYGSDYYSQLASDRGDNIVAVLNADMIGWQGDGSPAQEDLDLNLNSSWPSFGVLFENVARDYATGVVVNSFVCDDMLYSDHAPFWGDGFPAVCGITDNQGFCQIPGDYPYLHTSEDTIANCGEHARSFHGAAVRTFLAAAAELAEPLNRLASTVEGGTAIAGAWTGAGGRDEAAVFEAPGRCAAFHVEPIFSDGFELADFSAWSSFTQSR